MPQRRFPYLSAVLGLVIGLACMLSVAPAEARRVALVVGNGAYEAVPRLVNPLPDANAVAGVLAGHGFTVTRLANANRAALDAALRRFARDATGADVALFFFAGHGLQVDGQNYIVPTDARVARPTDLDFELVPLDLVVRALSGAAARVIILDACRDNPMAANVPAGTRSVGRGLAQVSRVDLGTLIAFSTSPGAVALDGTGRNSPFSEALVQHLRTPGLEIRQVMTRVRRSVVDATGGQQVPWDNSSLLGDVFIAPAASVARPPAPPPPSARLPAPRRDEAPLTGNRAVTPRLLAEASRRAIPLPADLPMPPPGAEGLAGAFATAEGSNRVGRPLLVIIAPVAGGAGEYDVLLAAGPGEGGGFSDGLGAFALRRTIRAGFGGALNLTDAAGDQYQIWRGWGGAMILQVTRPGLHGWVQGIGRNTHVGGRPVEQTRIQRIE